MKQIDKNVGWKVMREILDKEMPVRKSKSILPIILMVSSLVITGVIYFFFRVNEVEYKVMHTAEIKMPADDKISDENGKTPQQNSSSMRDGDNSANMASLSKINLIQGSTSPGPTTKSLELKHASKSQDEYSLSSPLLGDGHQAMTNTVLIDLEENKVSKEKESLNSPSSALEINDRNTFQNYSEITYTPEENLPEISTLENSLESKSTMDKRFFQFGLGLQLIVPWYDTRSLGLNPTGEMLITLNSRWKLYNGLGVEYRLINSQIDQAMVRKSEVNAYGVISNEEVLGLGFRANRGAMSNDYRGFLALNWTLGFTYEMNEYFSFTVGVRTDYIAQAPLDRVEVWPNYLDNTPNTQQFTKNEIERNYLTYRKWNFNPIAMAKYKVNGQWSLNCFYVHGWRDYFHFNLAEGQPLSTSIGLGLFRRI